MFSTLKKQWHQLRQAPAGRRFQRRYQQRQAGPNPGSTWRRLAVFAGALVLTAIGVVLMFIPGPAILFFFLAGALLAEESRAMARLFDWTEVRLRSGWRRVRRWWSRHSAPARAGVVLAGLIVTTGVLFLASRIVF